MFELGNAKNSFVGSLVLLSLCCLPKIPRRIWVCQSCVQITVGV